MSTTCLSPGIFGACLTRLTTGQAVGLMIDLESGFISSLAVVIFVGLVIRNVIRHYRDPPPGDWCLLRTHIDVYFLCLLLFEFIHGIAAILSMKWIHDGAVTCGRWCTTQGAARNIGSTGVALVTLVIAIHTFAVIFFRWIPPKSLVIPFTVLSIIWSFLTVYISYELVIPRAPDALFYSPTPYWCWIGPSHDAERVWGQYLWMWLGAFVSILLYVPLYFCVRGNLSYRPHSRWKIRITRTSALVGGCAPLQTYAAKVATRDAMCMLYYPVAYTLLVLPLSIVRFTSEKWHQEGKHFPFAPTVSGSAIFGLSGLVNVVLFVMTRPNLLLFRSETPPRCRGKGDRPPSEDTFGSQQQYAFPSFPPSIWKPDDRIVPGSQPMWDIDITREESLK